MTEASTSKTSTFATTGLPPYTGQWTRSGKAFLFSGLFFMLFGVAANQGYGLKLGMIISSLVLFDAIVFSLKVRAAFSGRLQLSRSFPDLPSNGGLWNNAELKTVLTIHNDSQYVFDDLEVWDLRPGRLQRTTPGGLRGRFPVGASGSVTVGYRAVECGKTVFPGMVLRLGSFSGLFYCEWIAALQDSINIYPPITARDKLFPVMKRSNRQWTLGIHEHRDKGMSMNLLELRDYIPGDPPKKIFWKASARLDKLIVRETESEVPVRAMLLLDTGASMRIQAGKGTALDVCMAMTATLAKVISDHRDPVGLYCFHETGGDWLLPGLGQKHLYAILRHMNKHATELSHSLPSTMGLLFDTVERFCRNAWPGLFHPGINKPARRWIVWSRKRSKLQARQKQVLACLAAYYRQPHSVIEHWLASPDTLEPWLRRFCNEMSLRHGFPLDHRFSDMFKQSVSKLHHLSVAMKTIMQRSKDNELYILATDLAGGLSDASEWQYFIKTLQLAIAQHHRVIVVMPWLPDFLQTDSQDIDSDSSEEQILFQILDRKEALTKASLRSMQQQMKQLESQAYAERLQACRHEIARTGAQVLAVGPDDSARQVIQVLSRMRYQKGALR